MYSYAAFFGVGRILNTHPAWRVEYRDWLKMTPWTPDKPLPLGPIRLNWRDGIVFGIAVLLAEIQPEPNPAAVLCTFLLGFLSLLAVTFWYTGCGEFGYLMAFTLALAVRLWHRPIACLAAMTVVYVIAFVGLRRAMARFRSGWSEGSIVATLARVGIPRREASGWPYDRLLTDVASERKDRRLDAILGCLLASWWLDAVFSLIRDPVDRSNVAAVVFCFALIVAPAVRLIVYVNGYHSPIGPMGRMRTGRWIIPGYDRVLVGPVASVLAGLSTLVLLRACGVPFVSCGTSATGMILLAALITPPDLRRWRLTGQHRIVPPISGMANDASNLLIQVK